MGHHPVHATLLILLLASPLFSQGASAVDLVAQGMPAGTPGQAPPWGGPSSPNAPGGGMTQGGIDAPPWGSISQEIMTILQDILGELQVIGTWLLSCEQYTGPQGGKRQNCTIDNAIFNKLQCKGGRIEIPCLKSFPGLPCSKNVRIISCTSTSIAGIPFPWLPSPGGAPGAPPAGGATGGMPLNLTGLVETLVSSTCPESGEFVIPCPKIQGQGIGQVKCPGPNIVIPCNETGAIVQQLAAELMAAESKLNKTLANWEANLMQLVRTTNVTELLNCTKGTFNVKQFIENVVRSIRDNPAAANFSALSIPPKIVLPGNVTIQLNFSLAFDLSDIPENFTVPDKISVGQWSFNIGELMLPCPSSIPLPGFSPMPPSSPSFPGGFPASPSSPGGTPASPTSPSTVEPLPSPPSTSGASPPPAAFITTPTSSDAPAPAPSESTPNPSSNLLSSSVSPAPPSPPPKQAASAWTLSLWTAILVPLCQHLLLFQESW